MSLKNDFLTQKTKEKKREEKNRKKKADCLEAEDNFNYSWYVHTIVNNRSL